MRVPPVPQAASVEIIRALGFSRRKYQNPQTFRIALLQICLYAADNC